MPYINIAKIFIGLVDHFMLKGFSVLFLSFPIQSASVFGMSFSPKQISNLLINLTSSFPDCTSDNE